MAQDVLLNDRSLLSDIKAPYINNIVAKRVLSNQILHNIFQGLIEKDGEGITQRFSSDTSGAEIRIVLPKPLKIEPRLLGGAINGGNFPTTARETEIGSVGVPVLFTIDEPIDIAEVSMDMLPIDIVGTYVKNWTDQVNLQINAMTIAGKFYATYKGKLQNKEVNEIVSTGTDLVSDFIDGNSLLDEGVEELGVSMFPTDDRVAVIRSVYRGALLKKGILTLNGSDRASRALEDGTLSAGATPRKLEDGYIGTVDGVPYHIANNLVWKTASKWLGLGEKEFESVIGYVSSGHANVRAIASPNNVVVDPHPFGRGVRLKPLFRSGFKTIEGFEKGNVFIVKNDFVNPYEEVVAEGVNANDIVFQPYGSRMDNGLVLTSSSAKVTATYNTGLTTKVMGAKGDAQGSVAKFKALANKVQLNNGSATTITGAVASDIVSILSVAKDGTCKVVTMKVNA